MKKDIFPMTQSELKRLKWKELDIILITGDAFIDHPSFGVSVIARTLENAGFRVGIISQPNWKNKEDFVKLGKPRLFFGITAGNLDSMVSNYTASLKKRKKDAYSPDGIGGKRPDRAVIVYANRCKEAFPDVPIIIGGIEASLRRFTHYDYWQDKLRNSILIDSRADILVYGNGEKQTLEIAKRLNKGETIEKIKDIPGTLVKAKTYPSDSILLPSHSQIIKSKDVFCEFFKILTLADKSKPIVQPIEHWYLIQNPRAIYTSKDLDKVFEFPYTNLPHPIYKDKNIPAWNTIKNSIQSHRGCVGGCSFCAIYFHEGKEVISRTPESIIKQAKKLTNYSFFHGTIENIGGPSANMYGIECKINWKCNKISCIYPKKCKNLIINHKKWIELLEKVRNLPKINNVFVESGIRFDLFLYDKIKYLEKFCKNFITGQLKVAPEHCVDNVLRLMRKPSYEKYIEFSNLFKKINKKINKKQYLIPYFISSHPGCTVKDMIELALEIKKIGHFIEQTQDFMPTPMTLSTCMFYTGKDPLTGEKIYVPRTLKEKKIQRALVQFSDPKNRELIYSALKKENRLDLVGKSKNCLISDVHSKKKKKNENKKDKNKNKKFNKKPYNKE